MANKGKSTKRKKAQQKQESSAIKKTTSKPIQDVEYEKLRDAIVEANKIIKEADENSKKKALEKDHMTKLLVELLNWLFGFAIVFLIICSIGAVAYSVLEAMQSTEETELISVIVCWLAFAADVIGLLVVNHFKKKKNLSKNVWIKRWIWVILVVAIATLVYTFIFSSTQFTAMALVILFVIILVFCYLAMQALKHETDRAYLVSYFSAITGIVALVVSVVALFVSRNPQ